MGKFKIGDEIICVGCGKRFKKKTYNNKYCHLGCREEQLLMLREEQSAARYIVFERDDFKCCYCGRSSIEDGISLRVNRLIPEGNASIYNVVTCCESCGSSRPLRFEIFRRILKRNILLNRGISLRKRLEVRDFLNDRYRYYSDSLVPLMKLIYWDFTH